MEKPWSTQIKWEGETYCGGWWKGDHRLKEAHEASEPPRARDKLHLPKPPAGVVRGRQHHRELKAGCLLWSRDGGGDSATKMGSR